MPQAHHITVFHARLKLVSKVYLFNFQIDNGLSEALHLTWLLVNKICILVLHWKETVVQKLIAMVQENSGAAGLLVQAVAARCQNNLKVRF